MLLEPTTFRNNIMQQHTEHMNVGLALRLIITGHPASIYLIKVKDEKIRTMCEICSKLTRKALKQYY